jgi:hypothetical protein
LSSPISQFVLPGGTLGLIDSGALVTVLCRSFLVASATGKVLVAQVGPSVEILIEFLNKAQCTPVYYELQPQQGTCSQWGGSHLTFRGEFPMHASTTFGWNGPPFIFLLFTSDTRKAERAHGLILILCPLATICFAVVNAWDNGTEAFAYFKVNNPLILCTYWRVGMI